MEMDARRKVTMFQSARGEVAVIDGIDIRRFADRGVSCHGIYRAQSCGTMNPSFRLMCPQSS